MIWKIHYRELVTNRKTICTNQVLAVILGDMSYRYLRETSVCLKHLLYGVLFIVFQPIIVYADSLSDELAKKSKHIGDVNIISSKSTDPIEIEGLWGLKGDFVVASNCKNAFDAMADVQNHPSYSKKIKEVIPIEFTEQSIIVDYTEGAYGFQTTSRLLWNFDSNNTTPSMTCKSIGKEDPPSWVKLQFKDAGNPDYCEIHVRMFADISYMPNFMMNWMSSIAAEELATTYREIIKGFVDTKK